MIALIIDRNREPRDNHLTEIGMNIARLDIMIRSMSGANVDNTESVLWQTLFAFRKLLKSKFALHGKGCALRVLLVELLHVTCFAQGFHSVIKSFVCEVMSEIRMSVSDRLGGLESGSPTQSDTRKLLDLAVDLQHFRKKLHSTQFYSSGTKLCMIDDVADYQSISNARRVSRSNKLQLGTFRVHSESNLKNRLRICSNSQSIHSSQLEPTSSTNSSQIAGYI
jgi:hypothetical protein